MASSSVQFLQNGGGRNEIKMTPGGIPIVVTDTGDLEMRAHELQHFIQYTKGQLAFITETDPNTPNDTNWASWPAVYDIEDEVEAYSVQFTVNPTTMPRMANGQRPTRLADITANYVRQIAQNYRDLPAARLSMSSSMMAMNVIEPNYVFLCMRDYAQSINSNITERVIFNALNRIPNYETRPFRDVIEHPISFQVDDQEIRVNFRNRIKFK